ncbi:MAG TPA: hypothetical protein VK589_29980 [Chryseolinea sp.]|nr:hypothetical protein [Chryseolinea sp.]
MITRKEIAQLYDRSEKTMRRYLRQAGINHLQSVTALEFQQLIRIIGPFPNIPKNAHIIEKIPDTLKSFSSK